MIRAALWQEIHRLFTVERWSKAAIAQALDVDRKTVRACLAQPAWTPYQRAPQTDTLLRAHCGSSVWSLGQRGDRMAPLRGGARDHHEAAWREEDKQQVRDALRNRHREEEFLLLTL